MRAWLVLSGVLWLTAVAGSQSIEERVESSTDPQDMQELWDEFRQHPLDLARADVREIASLPYFDLRSAEQIIRWREQRHGSFFLSDILALPGLSTVQRNVLNDLTVVRSRRRRQSAASVYNRALSGEESGIRPEAWSSRVRAVFRSDETRAFLFGVRNPEEADLFEETSVGIEIRQKTANARFILGDYQYEFGTGLIFAAPFGTGDWQAVHNAVHPPAARGLDLRPSSNRRLTYRGAAAAAEHGQLTVSFLASWTRRDAAMGDSGALCITEGEASSSAELAAARKRQLEERLVGAGLRADFGGIECGVAGYSARFNPPLIADEAELLPQLNGGRLNAGSAHVSAQWQGMHAVAEAAATDPGGTAYQTALSFRSQNSGFCIYHIRAAEDFFSLHSTQWNGFGSAAGNEKTTGVRLSTALPRHGFSVDFNSSQTPFRTATSPLRKNASAMAARWQFALSEEWNSIVRISRRWNEDGSAVKPWETSKTDIGRVELHWSRMYHAAQIRFEHRSAKQEPGQDRKSGTLLFLQGKHRLLGFDITGRLTFFNTESSDVMMQLYEMPLRGEYPIVVLNGSGRRVALKAAYDRQRLRPAIKIAQTRSGKSGNEQEEWAIGMELTYRY